MSDKVGDRIKAENASWDFGGDTPKFFDDHIERSIPLYKKGHDLIVQLSDFFIKEDSKVYDLGCSTGSLLYKLALHHQKKKNVQWIGMDREIDMVQHAQENHPQLHLKFNHDDFIQTDLEPADMIICYYSVQFVAPRHRQAVFDKIYKSLNWGGAMILFEKVRGPDARFQDIFTSLYTDYKLNHQYSPDEIVAKSRSLKGILEPFSTQANLDLMKRAGFVDITSILKYLCFEGFLAIK